MEVVRWRIDAVEKGDKRVCAKCSCALPQQRLELWDELQKLVEF